MVRVKKNGQVYLSNPLDVDASSEWCWEQIRDFKRFVCLDLFHKKVHFLDPGPRQGTRFELYHRFLCFSLTRRGKILRWQPDRGYAFSDLSRRGSRRGFPHACFLSLSTLRPGVTRIHLEVKGRWTLPSLPRPLILLWLWWVLLKIRISLQNELLRRMIRVPHEETPGFRNRLKRHLSVRSPFS